MAGYKNLPEHQNMYNLKPRVSNQKDKTHYVQERVQRSIVEQAMAIRADARLMQAVSAKGNEKGREKAIQEMKTAPMHINYMSESQQQRFINETSEKVEIINDRINEAKAKKAKAQEDAYIESKIQERQERLAENANDSQAKG